MRLNILPLKESDYDEVLCGWWKSWRWTSPPKSFLPENGIGGFMIYDEDLPVVAGFLYNTNSDVAWADWIISNFNYKDKYKRKVAINLLLLALEERAKKINKKFMYALVKNKSLVNVYKEQGYEEASSYTTELIKKL